MLVWSNAIRIADKDDTLLFFLQRCILHRANRVRHNPIDREITTSNHVPSPHRRDCHQRFPGCLHLLRCTSGKTASLPMFSTSKRRTFPAASISDMSDFSQLNTPWRECFLASVRACFPFHTTIIKFGFYAAFIFDLQIRLSV